jgi:hypothetical protein
MSSRAQDTVCLLMLLLLSMTTMTISHLGCIEQCKKNYVLLNQCLTPIEKVLKRPKGQKEFWSFTDV